MVPAVAKSGHSFKGAMAYYLHDKRGEGDSEQPLTADRVAWTAVRNLAVTDPEAATRIMIATAQQADQLKAAAGVKNTGTKSKAHVYAYSLSWRADEVPNLTREHMLECVDETLKLLGAENRQAVIVCHTDQKHPHVHVIVNRVDPENGKLLSASNDRYKLSDWANEYERKNGLIVTPKREEKRELREQFSDRAARQDYAGEKRRQAGKVDKTKAGMLKEFGDQQKADHAQQWKDLSARNKEARNKIWATYDERIKSAIANHKAESKPLWAAFFREQRAAVRAYERNERAGLVGKVVNAFNAAAQQKALGLDHGRGMLSMVFANTLSGQARRAIFDRRQELGRMAMQGQLKGILTNELNGLKDRRAEGLAKQRQAFDHARADLMKKQDGERAKIREAWSQIYSDRGKDAALRSTSYRARLDVKNAWQETRTATKEQRSSISADRGKPAMTREQIAKGIDRKEQLRRMEQARSHPTKPSYISRPAPAPAPAGSGPRPAQKSPAHLPAKELPKEKPRIDPLQAFKDSALRGVDTPAPSQSASEIRAQYGQAGRSSLEQKRERSRTRGRIRTRTRSLNDEGNDL